MSANLEQAIQDALRKTITEIAEQEIEEVKRRIEEKIRARMAGLVMAVFKNYEVQRDQDRIVISVKNAT